MRGRGLKLGECSNKDALVQSPPVRGRGLKPLMGNGLPATFGVAPRAGAWIETNITVSARDLKAVAPRAGAWIETTGDLWIADDMNRRPPCGGVD